MKKFNLFLIAVVLMGGVAFAQRGPGPGKRQGNVSPETRAQKMTERMVKELSLNENQTKELQAINLEFATQMKANAVQNQPKGDKQCCCKEHKNKKADKKDKAEMKKMRDNMKEAREARDLKLKKVLTEAQYTQYQKGMEQKAGERKGKHPAKKNS